MRIGRLSAEKEIRFVLRSGRTATLPLFRAKALKTAGTSVRLTVIISKKQCKSAVDRNRIRRRVVSAIRRHASFFLTSADLILFPNNLVLKATADQIIQNTLTLAKKINTLS